MAGASAGWLWRAQRAEELSAAAGRSLLTPSTRHSLSGANHRQAIGHGVHPQWDQTLSISLRRESRAFSLTLMHLRAKRAQPLRVPGSNREGTAAHLTGMRRESPHRAISSVLQMWEPYKPPATVGKGDTPLAARIPSATPTLFPRW